MARPSKVYTRILQHADEIINLYLKGYSKDELGPMYETTSGTILKLLRNFNIIRTKSHPKFGYDADKLTCLEKKRASEEQGFSYEIWVFDNNYNLTIIK